MNYLKSYVSTSQPEQSFWWKGYVNIEGGRAGPSVYKFLDSQPGQDGTMFHSKCFPGYSGVFCKACPIGTYKYDYSFGSCMQC